MSEIGTDLTIEVSALDRVAGPTAGDLKTLLAGADFGGSGLRLLLGGDPFCKVFRLLSDDLEEHIGVLHAAEFGATAPEDAGFGGIHPQVVDAVGNEICLAAEFGNPEAVNDVVGLQLEICGVLAIMRDGDVNLIGGDDVEEGITDLPPELMADDGDMEGVFGLAGVFDTPDAARGDAGDNKDDEDGDDGPSGFDLIAAVDLRRLLAAIVMAALAEADHGVDEQARDDGEDSAGDGEFQHPHVEFRFGGGGERVEDAGDFVFRQARWGGLEKRE